MWGITIEDAAAVVAVFTVLVLTGIAVNVIASL